MVIIMVAALVVVVMVLAVVVLIGLDSVLATCTEKKRIYVHN